MYKKKVFILIVSILAPAQIFAAMTDSLETAYHERYEQYTKEITLLQVTVTEYQTCISDYDNIGNEFVVLKDKYRRYIISKEEALEESLMLQNKNLAVLTKCMSTYNRARGEQRSNISIDEIKEDLEHSRKREREIIDKKQELKIKILEANEILPVWWTK